MSRVPKVPEFVLSEQWMTSVQEVETRSLLTNPANPTPEDLFKIIKGEHQMTITSHGDHPQFAEFRWELEREGFIEVQRSWSNGDRVLKLFKLNGVLFDVGSQFPCAAAMESHLRFTRQFGGRPKIRLRKR